MKHPSSIVRSLRIAGVLSLAACVKVDCVTVPCALPQALTITVSNSTGGVVADAVFQVQGQTNGSGPCNGTPTTCHINGSAGTYTVAVSAPGFQTASRTVTVSGTEAQECGCGTVNTERVNLVLVAN